MTTEAEPLLLHSRSRYYEYGDKAGRLLAHQLRRQAAARYIPRMRNDSGVVVEEPAQINSVFSSFYKSLYSSELPSDLSDMHTFLRDLEFPKLSIDVINTLDSPLTQQELLLAIQKMQNNKAPGPDGFPVEFFKAFHKHLVPLLYSVYTESLSSGSLPLTMRQASINVLLKKDKDPELCFFL